MFNGWRLYISTAPQSLGELAPAQMVQARSLREHVDSLCAFSPRDYLNPENLDAAADYIEAQWQSQGLQVQEQEYTFNQSFRNLYVEFPGQESKHQGALIIGAHYDALSVTPGADDNASGVAGLLELGRLFKKTAPPMPLILIAWTNEEQPFFQMSQRGSDHHALKLRTENRPIIGAISLEMIGRYYEESGTQVYPSSFIRWLRRKYDRGNFIAFVSAAESAGFLKKATQTFRRVCQFPVHGAAFPKRLGGNRILGSDHHSYMQQNYPAFMVTDTAENRRHPQMGSTYHTPMDTPDTLNYDKMAQLVEGIYKMVQAWR